LEEFYDKHGRYPKKTLIGTDFFGPQNEVWGYNPDYLPEAIAKTHDIQVTKALAIEDPELKSKALSEADRLMIEDMEEWWVHYAADTPKDYAYYGAYRFWIKSGAVKTFYYPFI